MFQKLSAQISEDEKQLDAARIRIQNSSVVPTRLTVQEGLQIRANLCKLTSNDGWKTNDKNQSWLEINEKDMEIAQVKAQQIFDLLKSKNVGDLILGKHSKTKAPVVKCSNINPVRLQAVTNQEDEDVLQMNTLS